MKTVLKFGGSGAKVLSRYSDDISSPVLCFPHAYAPATNCVVLHLVGAIFIDISSG